MVEEEAFPSSKERVNEPTLKEVDKRRLKVKSTPVRA
jgi:hypothetical protein